MQCRVQCRGEGRGAKCVPRCAKMCEDRWLHGTWPSTLMPSAWRQGAGVPREDAPRLASLAFLRQCTTPASSGSVLRSDSTTPRLHDQEAKKFSERYVTRPVLEEEVPRRNQYNILYNILSEMPSDSVLRGNFKTCLLDSVTTRHVLLGFGIVINVFADLSWFVLICHGLSWFVNLFSFAQLLPRLLPNQRGVVRVFSAQLDEHEGGNGTVKCSSICDKHTIRNESELFET